ncbi:MAG: AMP-binding protein [Muribaculaceae bacterium]
MGLHINQYIENSIRQNWEELALTDFKGVSYQYKDIARKIAKLHILFEETGIKPGDKVALCGRNSSQWAVAMFGALTFGAIPVPILHEFKPDNIHHLVNHCDARLFFVDQTIWENLDSSHFEKLIGVLHISDYSILLSNDKKLDNARKHLNELFGKKYPERFTPADVKYATPDRDSLAIINYTSGSMGFSKGVMIPYRAIESNIQFGIEHLTFLHPGDGVVCMLPLAHMYGLCIELIHTFTKGCHIYFLTRIPSPKVIMDAFATVHPKLIITVPLIIEKIIKNKVFPLLDKPLMKIMLKMQFIDSRLLGKIKERLTSTFGGNLVQIIIGGAALNKDVERFLRRIEFPYTVGYGMTECAPLIAYSPWYENKEQSCGRIVDRMTAEIDSTDPCNVAGELRVKGDNVMLGYYKNPEATAATIKDGWLYTGDLCTLDSDGFLFIRGRSKNMILGPSGQNIYPEEIEQRINNLPYVCESLVVEENQRLVALIYPDIEIGATQGLSFDDLTKIMRENIETLNKDLPGYSRIADLKVLPEEFEKTPKRSIKRFLYQH